LHNQIKTGVFISININRSIWKTITDHMMQNYPLTGIS
jgi:hypothetical protein